MRVQEDDEHSHQVIRTSTACKTFSVQSARSRIGANIACASLRQLIACLSLT